MCIFARSSIVDVWQGSQYASDVNLVFFKTIHITQRCIYRCSWLHKGPVWAQSKVFQSLYSFISSLCIDFFSFFVESYNSVKAENWIKLFWQNAWPKMKFFMFYGELAQKAFLFFCMNLCKVKNWNWVGKSCFEVFRFN